MDQLRQIEAFCAVVQHGSFVQAAERLDWSKAVVSRLVMELESRLGTRLLNRTTRKVSVTDSGAAYFERCRSLLDELADADREAAAASTTPSGLLRINAPVTFGNLHLAPLWGEFLKLHPQVELDITLTDRMVDLIEEGFDLAVRIGRPQDSSLIARGLTTDRVVLCASPGYLRLAPPLRQPQDLADHSVIAYSLWSGGDSWTLTHRDGTRDKVAVRPCLRANSGDTYAVTFSNRVGSRQSSLGLFRTDGEAERQPVWLTTEGGNPNGAQALFLIDGAEPGDLGAFERACLVFDGRDQAALETARSRWKQAKEQGIVASYWKESAAGKWEKQQ